MRYIANNHIAIDCASGYGGKDGCIRLDDFKCFYSKNVELNDIKGSKRYKQSEINSGKNP